LFLCSFLPWPSNTLSDLECYHRQRCTRRVRCLDTCWINSC